MAKKTLRPAERPQNRLPEGDTRHGTTTGYYYWNCRCEYCREFARDAGRKRKNVRMANLELEVHGLDTTYTNAGCRCEPCKAANKAAQEGRERIRNGPKLDLSALR